jgi:hypothetical protein
MHGRIGLDPQTLDRLAKLLGMLGSVHAGERAVAGLKAHELVRAHGLTWHDVLRPSALSFNDAQSFDWHRQRESACGTRVACAQTSFRSCATSQRGAARSPNASKTGSTESTTA